MRKVLLLHIPMLCLAYLMLMAAAVAGLIYIIHERRVKLHQALTVSASFPSLETLERFIYQMILYSFPLLTIGILLGTHWQFITRGRFWGWDPTETFSLVTWLIYALYLALRWSRGLRGRKSTYLALAGSGLFF